MAGVVTGNPEWAHLSLIFIQCSIYTPKTTTCHQIVSLLMWGYVGKSVSFFPGNVQICLIHSPLAHFKDYWISKTWTSPLITELYSLLSVLSPYPHPQLVVELAAPSEPGSAGFKGSFFPCHYYQVLAYSISCRSCTCSELPIKIFKTDCWGFLSVIAGFYFTLTKRCEVTATVIWCYRNKTKLSWTVLNLPERHLTSH